MASVMNSVTNSLSNTSFSTSVTNSTSSDKVCLSCGFPSSSSYLLEQSLRLRGSMETTASSDHLIVSDSTNPSFSTFPCSTAHITPTSGSSAVSMESYPRGMSYSMANESAASKVKHRWISRRSKLKGSGSNLETINEKRALYTQKTSVTWLDFKRKQDELRICRAVCLNDTDKVHSLLLQGVSPNCYDINLRTPLHLAASKGYTDMVRLLLDNGADPNLLDSIGNTPLHLAACTNNMDTVVLLLNGGTDVSSSNFRGRSPLQLAQSKLKILQESKNTEIKKKVTQIIDMLLLFLRKKQSKDCDAETEQLLAGFQTRLNISETAEEVNNEIDNLSKVLDQMQSLAITNPNNDGGESKDNNGIAEKNNTA